MAQDDEMLANPHSEGFFYRLMRLFGLTSHPVTMDRDEIGEDEGGAKDWWKNYFLLTRDRRERYRIFDEMDSFGLVSSVLDLYAEEVTQADYDKQRAIWIESTNPDMIRSGDECLRNLRMEDVISSIVRETCKYGDSMRRMIYETGKGVLGWIHVEPHRVDRIEDKYSRLIGFRESSKKYRQKQRNTSWPWDYSHFRLLGKDEFSKYGTSILEAMFRPWRQLILGEDALLIYRLRRAPDRNMIFVDVGDMEEHEAIQYVNAWRKRFRKHEFIDPSSAEYKKQYNPLTPIEDIFMPIRGDEGRSRVENMSGSGNMGDVYDIDHFRNVFFGTARVPKAVLGFEGEINAKATLMQQDVRFARTGKRIRRMAIYGVRGALDTHFTLMSTEKHKGKFDPFTKGNEYLVQMSPISYLDEFERLELMQLRFQIVEAMSALGQTMQIDPKIWATYILTDFAKLPDDMVAKLVAKTGQAPPGGGAESLTQRQRLKVLQEFGPDMLKQITENIGTEGYYELSKEERRSMAEAIHNSPTLRKVVADIAEYYEDDLIDEASMRRQIDPSLGNIIVLGKPIQDDYEDDEAAKELKEDLEEQQATLTEDDEEEKGESLNEDQELEDGNSKDAVQP